jgi:hypothetical protein
VRKQKAKYLLFPILLLVVFMFFNGTPLSNGDQQKTISGYTAYQIIMWTLKADEGYRAKWYSDGKSEAIGFGYNHLNKKKRKAIAEKYMVNGILPYDGANKLLVETWTLIKPPIYLSLNKKIAYILHCYNCGSVKKRWGKFVITACCGGRNSCGNSKWAKVHNKRRMFEKALWDGDYDFVEKYIERILKKESKNQINNISYD